MAEDDKLEDASGVYSVEGELVKEEKTYPTIPLPPDNVLKSAFLTAIKYRTVAKAIEAYNFAILELASTQRAISELNDAFLEGQRVVRKLENAEKIFKADAAAREARLIREEHNLEQVKHEAKLAELQRKVELAHAQKQHDALTGEEVNTTLTQEEEEFVEHVKAKIRPARYKQIVEDLIKEQGLNEEQQKIAKELAEKLSHQT